MSVPPVNRLLALMPESRPVSVAFLALELGCDEELVAGQIGRLRDLGVRIDPLAGGDFVLAESIELLDVVAIRAALQPQTFRLLTGLAIEASLDSTNSALRRKPVAQQHGFVMLAEHQSEGRGRHGRRWVSPFARNLYLSLGWRFDAPPAGLGCLPLVVALAVAGALDEAGLEGHKVKWPNDLLLNGRKLSGCLVDVRGDGKGVCHAVIGVGVNLRMSQSDERGQIDQAWTDLDSRLPGFSRNRFAGLLLDALLRNLTEFSASGFEPFRRYWRQLDGLEGQAISVYAGEESITGTALGIDENGALLLDTGKDVLRLHSGEVSLHQTSL
jgi:BirA family biotin operon repressor/biotin-[acetyl-CoA-carboxylase] ligase